MVNSKDRQSKCKNTVNAIELQSNKKVATPHFYIKPRFSELSPLSSKFFGTPLPQVTQFLEGPTPPLAFNKGGGVSNYGDV